MALVPLTRRGEVTGEEDILGREDILGLGATGGGMVALFIGGEYRALLLPRIPLGGESSSCSTRDSQGLQILGFPFVLSWSSSLSMRFSLLAKQESASSLVIS